MNNQFSRTITILAVVVLAAASARSQNLVTNGEFEGGISGWHLVGRGGLAQGSPGYNSAASLQVTGGLAGAKTQAIAGQCIAAIAPSQNHNFVARVRVVTGSPEFCRFAIFESERADCKWIDLGAEGRRTTIPDAWTWVGNSMTTAATTRSVEVRLHCANAEGDTGPLEVLFDTVLVQTSGVVEWIFGDGFETGDTSAWSATIP